MPDFVDDNTSLPYPKLTLRERPANSDARKYISADDWNAICQAAVDLRSAVQTLQTGTGEGDKGDITVSESGDWTIDTNVVTLSKLAQISTARFLGRTTASTGNVEELTGTQATALLDTFTTSAKGLVPAASGGSTTTQFLRKDGTWSRPVASYARVHNNGSVTSVATSTLTVLPCSTELYDTDAYHDTGSNTSRLTAPVTGLYLIRFGCQFATNTTGIRQIQIRRNANGSSGGGNEVTNIKNNASVSSVTIVDGSIEYLLTAGEYVEMFAFQTSGGNLDVTTSAVVGGFAMTLIGV